MSPQTAMAGYLQALLERMHSYAADTFEADRFTTPPGDLSKPIVFRKEHADQNVLVPPDSALAAQIIAAIPKPDRHLHFASMRSSQALAQSVFAGLAATSRLGLLAGVTADGGLPAFAPQVETAAIELEKKVDFLGEPRPTSVDVWVSMPDYRIAVECKFTEAEFGQCSRPRLPKTEPGYCDGTYRHQLGRAHRCSLTEIGVRYWELLPGLLSWDGSVDLDPCPLRPAYQVVRNLLAAVGDPTGDLNLGHGHALIVYDQRNPVFGPAGKAQQVLEGVSASLAQPGVLRSVSWQAIAQAIGVDNELRWLSDGLADKYGIG